MGRRLAMLLATGALALTAGPTLAHHSFAMFDRDNQVEPERVCGLTPTCRIFNFQLMPWRAISPVPRLCVYESAE